MTTQLQARYPFPESARPKLAAWYDLAREIELSHPARPSPEGMRGLGEPAGPRQWRDDSGREYKVFLVYFLPAGDRAPLNHHLSVRFDLGGRAEIEGGNHAGTRLTLRRDWTPEQFRADLRLAARKNGMLPGEAA